jgi:hypothetical protein
MKQLTLNRITFALALSCVISVPSFSLADLVDPSGVNPGELYHWAFLTDGVMAPESSAISTYNAFVTEQAELTGSLFEAYGFTWFAIGSTAAVDARDNAVVQGAVYLPNGTKIADGFADMWDGTIDNPFNVDQFGNPARIADRPFTGSTPAGIGATGLELGSGDSIMLGNPEAIDGNWMQFLDEPDPFSRRIYALSEVQTAVPEPGSFILMSIGGAVGLIGFGRRRRKRHV